MSDELFEVAFCGQISDGAQLNEVKQRVGKMFNADSAKLDQLFSGRRVVIKKNIDQQTALKYQNALSRAGAECEIKSVSAAETGATNPVPSQQPEHGGVTETAAVSTQTTPPTSTAGEDPDGDTTPPSTDPLGITGDQIEDLAITIAPVGSELQDEIKAVPEPEYDLAEFDVAPVGSTLGSAKKQTDPPLPDTTGITMADE